MNEQGIKEYASKSLPRVNGWCPKFTHDLLVIFEEVAMLPLVNSMLQAGPDLVESLGKMAKLLAE